MRPAVAALGVAAVAALGFGFIAAVAETISWSARPTIVNWNESVTASGTIGSGRPDQLVTIQFRPCEGDTWGDLGEATTTADGGWTVDVVANIGGLIRVRSGDVITDPVTIRQRPWVFFSQRRPGRFRAGVQAYRQFWHRKLTIQRFDTKTRRWIAVKRVLLTDTAGSTQSDIASTTDQFRVDVPKGTTLRATLPLSQAGPCYLAGYSAILRR